MKNFLKGKFGTVIILLFTVILAGVAIFTALRLYQLRSQPVAPNVPSSIPRAQEVTPPPAGACTLSFTISSASPTPTPTPTATPTATPVPQCNDSCTSSAQCSSGLVCNISSGATTGNCRNASCLSNSNCVCATATPTATPTGSPTATPTGTATPTATPRGTGTPRPTATPTAPALPVSGTDWPTILGAGFGLFVIIGSLLLAL